MPSTIVETVGSATANSYVTVVEMDTYCDDRLNAGAWNDETDSDVKARAILEAQRELASLSWKGSRTDSTQALDWPREYVVDPDLPWAVVEAGDSYYYDNDTIPQRVKDAQMEIALQYLKAGTTDLAVRDSKLDVKREKVDVIETEFFEAKDRAQGLAKYPRVQALLAPLLEATPTGTLTVERV